MRNSWESALAGAPSRRRAGHAFLLVLELCGVARRACHAEVSRRNGTVDDKPDRQTLRVARGLHEAEFVILECLSFYYALRFYLIALGSSFGIAWGRMGAAEDCRRRKLAYGLDRKAVRPAARRHSALSEKLAAIPLRLHAPLRVGRLFDKGKWRQR